MKTVAVLFVVFTFSQVQGRTIDVAPSKTFFTPLQEECLKELKLEDQKEAISSLNNREICPEDHASYNKFISCFWKKTGRQNANGDVNYENIRLFVRAAIVRALGDDAEAVAFAEENSTKITNKCKDNTEVDSEKVVVKVRNCVVKGINAV